MLLALLLTACGSKSEGAGNRATADDASGTVVVTTPHGRTLEFKVFLARCPKDTEDLWGQDADVVYAYATLDGERPTSRRDPLMTVTAGAGVADGTTITMPNREVYGEAKTFVSVFITRAGRATELSNAAEESFGHIVIDHAACDPPPAIDMRIDGTLHSEYNNGGRAAVVGEVHAG
jgi:hypothetical protein